MVDALSSGGSIRKVVLVRIQSRAQLKFETLVNIEFDRGFIFLGELFGDIKLLKQGFVLIAIGFKIQQLVSA